MTKEELLARYEALGEERDSAAARRLYEQALAEAPDARLLNEYGYPLECHGRRELRHAVELYERAAPPSCSSGRGGWWRPPRRGARSSRGTSHAGTRCRASGRSRSSAA